MPQRPQNESAAALKRCSRCCNTFKSDFFYKNRTRYDGLSNWCKACNRITDRAKSDTPKGRAKQADRDTKRSPGRWNRNRRRDHPEKVEAKQSVRAAIKAGALTRQPCERCGVEPTHAHHESYDRPLEVTWLCSRCHGLRHRELNDAALLRTQGMTMPVDRFSAIDDLSIRDQRDTVKVLRKIREVGRFSCFEATEPPLGSTLADIEQLGLIETTPEQYPWTRATLTSAGEARLLAEDVPARMLPGVES